MIDIDIHHGRIATREPFQTVADLFFQLEFHFLTDAHGNLHHRRSFARAVELLVVHWFPVFVMVTFFRRPQRMILVAGLVFNNRSRSGSGFRRSGLRRGRFHNHGRLRFRRRLRRNRLHNHGRLRFRWRLRRRLHNRSGLRFRCRFHGGSGLRFRGLRLAGLNNHNRRLLWFSRLLRLGGLRSELRRANLRQCHGASDCQNPKFLCHDFSPFGIEWSCLW